MVQTRFLSLGKLRPIELAALRFTFAALVLFPILLRRGWILAAPTKAKGFVRGVILSACSGVPYVLLVASGMEFAPAGHAATLINAAMVTTTILLAVVFFREAPRPMQIMGTLSILGGLALLLANQKISHLGVGHLMFVLGGVLWAFYSSLLKKWGAHPLHATAIAAVYSAFIALPLYAILQPTPLKLSAREILIYGSYQGIITGAVALFLFSFGVARLGATQASMYVPFTPVLTVILAFLFLGETPNQAELCSMGLVVGGFIMATWAQARARFTLAQPSKILMQ